MSETSADDVPGEAKHGGGRPRAKIDPARVAELAGQQMSIGDIATCLGISRRCLFNRMKQEPELRTAYEHGLAVGVAKAAGVIKKAINEGNLKAAMFFLKTKGGWTAPPPD
jgi:hypothetical protein